MIITEKDIKLIIEILKEIFMRENLDIDLDRIIGSEDIKNIVNKFNNEAKRVDKEVSDYQDSLDNIVKNGSHVVD